MIQLDEIRSNRVVGVLAAYVVIAFAVLEGLDILEGALGLPDIILTVAAVLALAGLPVAGALAWYSERRDAAPPAPRPTTRAWKVGAVGAVAAVLVALVGLWITSGPTAADEDLDTHRVAVLPFATGGAGPGLAWLEQGAMDLLAAKLTGEFGPRAIDPRSVLSRSDWSGGGVSVDRAVEWARSLGAGYALTGNVVGSESRFTMSASLLDARTGEERSRASVETDASEFPAAADRLVIALLSLEAGEAEHRLAALTSRRPSAVRDYLAGQSLYREGRYHESAAAFERALNADSAFALAGLGLSAAASMATDPEVVARAAHGRRLAAAARENLSPVDRRFLEAEEEARTRPTVAGQIRSYEAAVRELPDYPELWYLLGDTYFHAGALVDTDDPMERARRAFDRAVALDSLHYVALQHLSWISIMREEYDEARHLLELRGRLIESPDLSYRLDRAVAHRDTQAVNDIWRALDRAPARHLFPAVWSAYGAGPRPAPHVADRAIARLVELASTASERRAALDLAHHHALNAGRPAEALALTDRLLDAGAERTTVLRQRVLDALYWEGDPEAGARAAADLAATLEQDEPPLDPEAEARVRCATRQWDAAHGRPGPRQRARLREAARELDDPQGRLEAGLCAAIVDAVLAWNTGSDETLTAAIALDSILSAGPRVDLRQPGNIAAARVFGAIGEYDRALRAASRVMLTWGMERYWTPLKLEEARWAERAGEVERARDAYAEVLYLRYRPEPEAHASTEEIRRRLEVLIGEPPAR